MTSDSIVPRLRLDVVRADQVLKSSSGSAITFGRDPACDVHLPDPHISTHHGEIFFAGQRAVYQDLKSRNGSEIRRGSKTIVVDVTIGHQCPLENGDEVRLGNPLEPVILKIRLFSQGRPVEAAPAAVPAPSPVVQDDAFVEKNVMHANRYADIDTIRNRVGDDKRALQCLYNLLSRLTAARDRDSMLRAVTTLLFESFEVATDVTVYLAPAQAGGSSDFVPAVKEGEQVKADRFKPVLAVHRSGGTTTPSPLSRMMFERVTQKGDALLFEDALKSFPKSESIVISRVQSGLCVPLRDRAGIRGILQIDNRKVVGAFTPLDLDLATLVGNHVALVLNGLEMYESVMQLNRELRDALMRVRLLDQAKDHLARFVPEAVRQMVDKSPAAPQLGMVDADATVLFLDIGGYTKLTEKLDREQVSFLIEKYFSAFIDDIYQHHGDINETAGDGLMVIFRADQPLEHARSAVSAALAIRQKTAMINKELAGEMEPIDVNQGINTGTVLIGSRRIKGITGARWTYTATGMVTNVTARLAAHAVKGQIMIGEETAKRVREVIVLKEIGPVQFKNVAQPLPVFEVLEHKAGGATGKPSR
jgi:class 3 adenylate cyclase/pSer/pThr/pTyr-binding forkhead associated (FHA) protein